MACPTCDHTMKNIGHRSMYAIFWCPRCGTLKNNHDNQFEAPKLVERSRALRSLYNTHIKESDKTGRTIIAENNVDESINKGET